MTFMKTYHASYRETGSWGYYQYYDYVVRAEDEKAALEKVMADVGLQEPTKPDLWLFEEITDDVTFISRASC